MVLLFFYFLERGPVHYGPTSLLWSPLSRGPALLPYVLPPSCFWWEEASPLTLPDRFKDMTFNLWPGTLWGFWSVLRPWAKSAGTSNPGRLEAVCEFSFSLLDDGLQVVWDDLWPFMDWKEDLLILHSIEDHSYSSEDDSVDSSELHFNFYLFFSFFLFFLAYFSFCWN